MNRTNVNYISRQNRSTNLVRIVLQPKIKFSLKKEAWLARRSLGKGQFTKREKMFFRIAVIDQTLEIVTLGFISILIPDIVNL